MLVTQQIFNHDIANYTITAAGGGPNEDSSADTADGLCFAFNFMELKLEDFNESMDIL